MFARIDVFIDMIVTYNMDLHLNIKPDPLHRPRKGFTLIEIMVVVAILALLAVLTLPSIRAMQAGNARAQAYNTINAALQAARSYAIMNGINTAARFQPNGKVFMVYQISTKPSGSFWNGAIGNFPDNASLFLPVLDQEPLRMPRGYAVRNDLGPFQESFYICYNPSGTLVQTNITVALVDDATATNARPVNPDFNGVGLRTWKNSSWTDLISSAYSPSGMMGFVKDEIKNNDVEDTNDKKLTRFYLVARTGNNGDIEEILEDQENGPDHYAGQAVTTAGNATTGTISPSSVSKLSLFQTPENWDQLPIFLDGTGVTKSTYVAGLTATQFDTIFINPYTGRVIRPVE